MPSGARLAVALTEPGVVHWGHDGWQQLADVATEDSGLGFHVAALETAMFQPGSRIDFTWRNERGWAGRDATVAVVADAAALPDDRPKDRPARGAGGGI
jgi:glucoamylase